ncbi:TIGR02270 family protein [Sorangium sp. So ce394]|uniref:TIGR02270 family protein n=1 Tax=Sorangium sp. So ce394 TaxID=3133310 RepID=UPI003F5CA6DF
MHRIRGGSAQVDGARGRAGMSATLQASLCEEHADQAAFLWLLRDRAARSAAYGLEDLAELDDRIEAHLDGLRLAGDAGWEACRALLQQAEGGEVFGAAIVAVHRWDLRGLARVLDVGGGAPDVSRGIASALGWTPLERVRRLLPGLLSGRSPPALQWLGIAACAAHGEDPGAPLGYALLARDPRLRARALRAAGQLGRVDLLPEVRASFRADDEACRFWAAWSAALLGEGASALVLRELANGGGPFAAESASMAMRRMAPAVASTWLRALERSARDPRVPVSAAWALGDPAAVPWLLEVAGDPALARLSGQAISLITGLDLAAEQLARRAPSGLRAGPTDDPSDHDVAMDPDGDLPFPDVAGVSAWWRRRAAEYRPGTRYLLGRAMTREGLEHALREGHQIARGAAAVELSLRERGRAVFEVRGPGFAQQEALGRLG